MNLHDLGRILSDPRHRIYVKLAILGLLIAVSLLPLQSIRGLIVERQETGRAVEHEIALTWGGEQRIIGPVLVVPLTGGAKDRVQPSSETETGITYAPDKRSNDHDRLFILPDSLSSRVSSAS